MVTANLTSGFSAATFPLGSVNISAFFYIASDSPTLAYNLMLPVSDMAKQSDFGQFNLITVGTNHTILPASSKQSSVYFSVTKQLFVYFVDTSQGVGIYAIDQINTYVGF